ncbi:Hypothetical predicted protein [Olea europaea subsp. europaea]|uniref:Uncharacterized protein n=1 Tax=Olea europaea subsp. europaea TaxID=158383 RepID=A0A8S0TKF4_OLEEU|nr:Hypothetical predicted protein [Olea europaea subsp. europaea]
MANFASPPTPPPPPPPPPLCALFACSRRVGPELPLQPPRCCQAIFHACPSTPGKRIRAPVVCRRSCRGSSASPFALVDRHYATTTSPGRYTNGRASEWDIRARGRVPGGTLPRGASELARVVVQTTGERMKQGNTTRANEAGEGEREREKESLLKTLERIQIMRCQLATGRLHLILSHLLFDFD